MQITRNPKREAVLLDQIRATFANNERGGVHLSDLLNPRRSYWQRVLPMPPSNAEVLYWLAGRGHEDALGRVAGMTVTEQKEYVPELTARNVADYGRTPMKYAPISYRPDFTLYEVPGEFKTRRANLAGEGEEALIYETYLEQLRGYCALERTRNGVLIVLSLLEGRSNDPLKPTEPALAVYDVTFTQEELDGAHELLMSRRDDFEAALVGWSMEVFAARLGGRAPRVLPDAHKTLPLCKDWMCGKPLKVVEKKPYCKTCDKEFATQFGIEKHTSSKSGAGHDVQNEVARWEYVPRCKWYAICAPQEVDPMRGSRLTPAGQARAAAGLPERISDRVHAQ